MENAERTRIHPAGRRQATFLVAACIVAMGLVTVQLLETALFCAGMSTPSAKNRVHMSATAAEAGMIVPVVLVRDRSPQDTSGRRASQTPQSSQPGTVSQEHDEGDDGGQPPYVLKPWRALTTHLHNKIIHVPIGFSMAAFLLSVIGLRWADVQPAIRWLVLAAALGAIVAFITGTNQAEVLEGSSKEWIIDIHRTLGITTNVALWAWAVVAWTRRKTWVTFAFGVLAMSLILVTGFFGGIVAHG